MFLRYFLELPLPARRVEGALLGSPATWLPGLAGDAEERGEALLVEVGIGAAPLGPRLGKQVKVQFGEVARFPSKIVLPMVWEPASAGALFPRLDADIEVGPLGPERTQVAISGRYSPPLGQVGRVIDRALLHRVAEATVKDFLDRVAARLFAPDQGPGHGAAGRI
jgi:hypothetical protein